MANFDTQSELLALKAQTKSLRKRSYKRRKSRLDKYKFELLELHQAGATGAELQRYLRSKRIKLTHSTVQRWLANNG